MAEQQARRGDELLAQGKTMAARQAYERAARAGNAHAAMGMGTTYDPVFLAGDHVERVDADALVARVWYLRAKMYGNRDAESRLAALNAATAHQ